MMYLLSCKTFNFFQSKTKLRTKNEDKPFQPVMWRVFTSTIDRNTKKFRI